MSATDTRDRPAPSARLRFVPKKIGEGRTSTWRVYDIQNGSFPYATLELGTVAQDATEAAIRTECDRLTAKHGYVSENAKRAAAHAKPQAAPVIDDEDEDDDEDEG